MSSTSLVPPDTSPPPPARVTARIAAILTALLLLFGGVFFPSPAQAATLGTGYGDENLFIGAFSSHGRQTYCMDLGLVGPWGTTQPPELATTLDSLSRTQLAELNHVMGRWGESRDPNITSAVAMFVWDVADHDVYLSKGGDSGLITRVPGNQQATVLAHLAGMRDAAASNAVKDPSVSLSIAMTDQYHGTLTITADPASLSGTVSLSNATFADGSTSATPGAGTHQIVGTPPEGAHDYRVRAAFTASSVGR